MENKYCILENYFVHLDCDREGTTHKRRLMTLGDDVVSSSYWRGNAGSRHRADSDGGPVRIALREQAITVA